MAGSPYFFYFFFFGPKVKRRLRRRRTHNALGQAGLAAVADKSAALRHKSEFKSQWVGVCSCARSLHSHTERRRCTFRGAKFERSSSCSAGSLTKLWRPSIFFSPTLPGCIGCIVSAPARRAGKFITPDSDRARFLIIAQI